jgi:hypothetical protein
MKIARQTVGSDVLLIEALLGVTLVSAAIFAAVSGTG